MNGVEECVHEKTLGLPRVGVAMRSLCGWYGGSGELDFGQFVEGEPIVGSIGQLANYEDGTANHDASAGINCFGVSGVELTSYECGINE